MKKELKKTKSYKFFMWIDSIPHKVKKVISDLLFLKYLKKHKSKEIYNHLIVPDSCFKTNTDNSKSLVLKNNSIIKF